MVAIHDAVTILYLTNPELFAGRNVTVNVDCGWDVGRGRTVCVDQTAQTVTAGKETGDAKPLDSLCKEKSEEDGNHQQPVYLLDRVNLPEFQKILLSKMRSLG